MIDLRKEFEALNYYVRSKKNSGDLPVVSREVEVGFGTMKNGRKFNQSIDKKIFDSLMNNSALFTMLEVSRDTKITEKSVVEIDKYDSDCRNVTIMNEENGKMNKMSAMSAISAYYECKKKRYSHTMTSKKFTRYIPQFRLSSKERYAEKSDIEVGLKRERTRTSFISDKWRLDFTVVNNDDNDVSYEFEIEYFGDDFDEMVNGGIAVVHLINELSIGNWNDKNDKNDGPEKVMIYYELYKRLNYISRFRESNYPPMITICFRSFNNMPRIYNQVALELTTSGDEYVVAHKADGVSMMIVFINGITYAIDGSDKIIRRYKGDVFSLGDKFIVHGEHTNGKMMVYDIVNVISIDDDLPTRQKLLYRLLGNTSLIIKPVVSVREIRKLTDANYIGFETDGIVFTPKNTGFFDGNVYKWKPRSLITIDFKVRFIDGLMFLYSAVVRGQKDDIIKSYKTNCSRLFSKFEKYVTWQNDRDHILFMHEAINSNKILASDTHNMDNNRAIVNPLDFIIKLPDFEYDDEFIFPNSKEFGIFDGDIVEFMWLNNKYGWLPIRVREDKKKANNYAIAHETFELIQKPIMLSDILARLDLSGGSAYRSEYGTRSAVLSEMKSFHHTIKYEVYGKYVKGKKRLLELAGGNANDLNKWVKCGVKQVTIVEVSKESIDEGQRRIKELRKKIGNNKMPTIKYIHEDINDEDILNTINEGSVTPGKKFHAIVCMFAIHYLDLDRLMDIICTFLQSGGYFIAMSLDGRTVFNELAKTNDGVLKFDNEIIISASYNVKQEKKFIGYGQEIEVFIKSIGKPHPEHLVNYETLKQDMYDRGLVLIDDFMFSEKQELMGKKAMNMTEAIKKYSFMNRCIVFKREKK